MRTTILRLLAMLALVTSGVLGTAVAAAQDDDDLDEDKIEQSYVKAYMTPQDAAASPEAAPFIMMVAVLDMVDETAATEQMDDMLGSMEDDDDYTSFQTEDVDDIGDRAVHYTAEIEDSSALQSGTIAREGKVLVFVMTLGEGMDEQFATDVTKHVLEHGASDAPVERDDNSGALTGGWVDAFPTAEDFPELEGMDGNHVFDLLEDGFFGDDGGPANDDDNNTDDDTDDDDND